MLDFVGFFIIIINMNRKDLKIGQTIKTNSFWHTKELFQIVKEKTVSYTPKRVKLL